MCIWTMLCLPSWLPSPSLLYNVKISTTKKSGKTNHNDVGIHQYRYKAFHSLLLFHTHKEWKIKFIMKKNTKDYTLSSSQVLSPYLPKLRKLSNPLFCLFQNTSNDLFVVVVGSVFAQACQQYEVKSGVGCLYMGWQFWQIVSFQGEHKYLKCEANAHRAPSNIKTAHKSSCDCLTGWSFLLEPRLVESTLT